MLSNAGHIASLVNPPGNPKASYYTGGEPGAGPGRSGSSAAEQRTGTWWEPWADWMIERSGRGAAGARRPGQRRPPGRCSRRPGAYVRDEVPA